MRWVYANAPAVIGAVTSLLLTILVYHRLHIERIGTSSRWAWLPFSAASRTPLGMSDFPLYTLSHLKMMSATDAALPAQQVIALYMATDDFWLADLTSLSGLDMLVPVYTSHVDRRVGLLYMPREGAYNLTVRVPRPTPRQNLYESEPPHCYMYWATGYAERLQSVGGASSFTKMRRFCNLDKHQVLGTAAANAYGGAFDPVPLSQRKNSIIFETTIRFTLESDTIWRPASAQLRALARHTFGPSVQALRSGGQTALGYWAKDGIIGTEPGTHTYQPQREHCPLQYAPWFGALQRSECSAIHSPVYRWSSYTQTRKEWMLSKAEMQQCVRNKSIRIYGDSLSIALFRSFHCILAAYADMRPVADFRLEEHSLFWDIGPFFGPREAQIDISDEESEKILWTNDAYGSAIDIELWLIGMWPISYAASTEWARGQDQIVQHIRRRTKQRNIRPIIITATAPNSDASDALDQRWQSVDRAYLWNARMRDAAARYNIQLIDLFWPTAHRFDARFDNAHFCDYLYYEMAAIVLKEMCS